MKFLGYFIIFALVLFAAFAFTICMEKIDKIDEMKYEADIKIDGKNKKVDAKLGIESKNGQEKNDSKNSVTRQSTKENNLNRSEESEKHSNTE